VTNSIKEPPVTVRDLTSEAVEAVGDSGSKDLDSGSTLVTLGPACTIREAVALKAHLLDQLATRKSIEIDGSGVDHIDTAGVQLLVALVRECGDSNIRVTWREWSAVVSEALRTLGLTTLAGIPVAPTQPGVSE